jgi:archaellum component FlaF (FlaF/FlaG flagellin family)
MAYTTNEQPYNQMGDGRQVVATAGTRVQLSSTSTLCKKVEITAFTGNTAAVVVGSSTVVAAEGTERGKILFPGDSVTIYVDNLNKIYIDARVSGEGVSYIYYL